jgi:hypothetical protein
MDSPFSRFTDAEVREMLRGAGLPDALDDDNVRKLGLVPTQRAHVLALYSETPDVDVIFGRLRGAVPKSSIRAYLCRAYPNGEWRQRRHRRSRHD